MLILMFCVLNVCEITQDDHSLKMGCVCVLVVDGSRKERVTDKEKVCNCVCTRLDHKKKLTKKGFWLKTGSTQDLEVKHHRVHGKVEV